MGDGEQFNKRLTKARPGTYYQTRSHFLRKGNFFFVSLGTSFKYFALLTQFRSRRFGRWSGAFGAHAVCRVSRPPARVPMSTIRVKRKHVLDSDSETDDDEAAPGEKTNSPIATTGVVAVAAVVADGSDDDNVANDKPTKRLMSAADRDAKASVEAKANVRDEVDLVGGKGDGDEGERSSPIELHDDSNDDSDSGGDKAHTEDPALVRCAQISRRLRRALGDGVGSSDGPLSPTHGGSSQQSARALGGGAKKNATKKRVLVSAADVASLAGKNSRCDSLKPYQMIGINFLLLLDEQDVPGAILADEMGLGKTAQTIAYLTMSRYDVLRVSQIPDDCLTACRHKTLTTFLLFIFHRHRKAHGEGGWHKSVNNSSIGSKGGGNKLLQAVATQKNASKSAHEPALVVAPASLLENWKRELTTWAPTLRVGFYHGAAGQKEVREVRISQSPHTASLLGPITDYTDCLLIHITRD